MNPTSLAELLERPQTGFAILDSAVAEQRRAWLDLWRAWPEREPFAHPGYVEAFLTGRQRALCAAQVGPSGALIFPVVLRPLSDEAWAPQESVADLTSPYGYGGPFRWGEVDHAAFWEGLESWAHASGVVSLVARLSLFSEDLAPFRGEVREIMKNVVRRLEPTPDALLMDYEHKVRKNIKKALRSGATVEWDLEGARLDEFLGIYRSTMDRREAASGYYFPESFFRKLIEDCCGCVAFAFTMLDGRAVSCELVLVGAERTYSFLGGTLSDAFDARPNDLLKHEIILWSRARGKSAFVLGGGYGVEDGIFRYKKSLAPSDGIVPFYLGTRVFDRRAYERLEQRRRTAEPDWEPSQGFFPSYRAPKAQAVREGE